MSDLEDAHRELEDLYDRILWACENDERGSTVRERIRSFLTYSRWHFVEEENLMRQLSYPGYLEHKADHRRLLGEAGEFVDSFDGAPRPGDGPAIVSFFKYWLTAHMAGMDSGLIDFVKSINDPDREQRLAGSDSDTTPANDTY